MLNISPVNQNYESLTRKYDGIRQIEAKSTSPLFKRFLHGEHDSAGTFVFPWTRIYAPNGMVTTLYPDKGHRNFNLSLQAESKNGTSKEGDKVRKGDTILRISS